MENSSILIKNEHEANRFTAKVMLSTIPFIVLVYILDLLHVFIVPIITMTVALSISTILLIIPGFIVFTLKIESWWTKYMIISSAALMVAFLSMFLSYHVVLMYVYTIAIASLYFSRRLSWYAIGVSIITISIAQLFSSHTGGVTDKNFTTAYELFIYGVIPRDIAFLAISLIFIALSKRTRKMLSNVMGAEEQKFLLDKMVLISGKSGEVSNTLSLSVRQLSDITDKTSKANEEIAEKTVKIASGSRDTINLIKQALGNAKDISSHLDMMAEEAVKITDISQQVSKMTQANSKLMGNAVEEMDSINQSTTDTMKIINRLSERSAEIEKIVDVITSISAQTNMLALNAAIESARAGEQGKGFAVVSNEIRSLAEQSQKAAKDISIMIKDVISDTENAVESMNKNSRLVEKGLEVINEAGSSFEKLSSANMEMGEKVRAVSKVTINVAENGKKIVTIVDDISDINQKNLDELQNIAAAAEQELASMQQVASSVNTIEKISSELLEIVNEN